MVLTCPLALTNAMAKSPFRHITQLAYVVVWLLRPASVKTDLLGVCPNPLNPPGKGHEHLFLLLCTYTSKVSTSTSLDSWSLCRSTLFCFTYSNTLPLDMNGIISRGISSSKHSPMSGITLGCTNNDMVDTSFNNFSFSTDEDSAA